MSNVEFAKTWFEEVWNKGNKGHIDKYLSDDCDVAGLQGSTICCPAEFHQFHQTINQGFADLIPDLFDSDSFHGS